MACLVRLKEDIKFLETTLAKEGSRFIIISASVDEVACRFFAKNGESVVINANITVGDTCHFSRAVIFVDKGRNQISVYQALAICL